MFGRVREANVTRNDLDWLTQTPWGEHTPENYSIVHAQKVLDDDRYGFKDVKDRILEFLAVGKRRRTVEEKTIYVLLVHQIIQVLKRVEPENPLALIDEVNKIRQINSDPASALSEMLDPEQNNTFLNHYMDVPVDLSHVLFVCTSKSPFVHLRVSLMITSSMDNLDTIPAPLLDGMEVLEVSGYVSEEKAVFAQEYLGPQASDASGLKGADVKLDREAVNVLIKYYCRESGVQNFKKHIDKIYLKAALNLVRDLGEDAIRCRLHIGVGVE
ncbi:hypothetical protein BDN72DRAFT_906898 [Pluteus cervinus]|uniref:Uncharacterized protein n=1 Tax=Pluteus cervinus TaxID=181527 RepID=A0ACD2ZY53_9AGAR|nr:hypothetical protein BDN72DRAFT_906898 [Pluteus cervinus]